MTDYEGRRLGIGGHEPIAANYNNADTKEYIFVQYKKEFLQWPMLCKNRTAAVAVTKGWFRRPERKELDWVYEDKADNTPVMHQVWVIKLIGTKWLIHRFYGNLSELQAQELLKTVLNESH